MQPPQTTTLRPEQASFARDTAVRQLTAEHPVTLRVLDAIPIDKGNYRPDAVAKSAVDLAWHIVVAEHRFMDAVVTGVFDYSNTSRPDTLTNAAAISRWYAEAFEQDLGRIVALPAELLARPVDFRGIITLPAVTFLMIGLKHSIHHRGQLSMYLRPMGAKVPSIYGESYDSAQAAREPA
jgi:uncharacterized damage-inducible protein DinB